MQAAFVVRAKLAVQAVLVMQAATLVAIPNLLPACCRLPHRVTRQ